MSYSPVENGEVAFLLIPKKMLFDFQCHRLVEFSFKIVYNKRTAKCMRTTNCRLSLNLISGNIEKEFFMQCDIFVLQ